MSLGHSRSPSTKSARVHVETLHFFLFFLKHIHPAVAHPNRKETLRGLSVGCPCGLTSVSCPCGLPTSCAQTAKQNGLLVRADYLLSVACPWYFPWDDNNHSFINEQYSSSRTAVTSCRSSTAAFTNFASNGIYRDLFINGRPWGQQWEPMKLLCMERRKVLPWECYCCCCCLLYASQELLL